MKRRGVWIRACAAAVFDAHTMEHVVDPAIADLQHEPLSLSRYLAVLKTLVLCIPEGSIRLGTACVVSALAAAAVVGLLEAPFLMPAWHLRGLDLRMPLYLAPATSPMAMAVGLAVGIVSAGRNLSRRARAWIIGVATIASALSFVNLGWITPATNQAARVMFSTRVGYPPPPRGINELTFGEVRHQFFLATHEPDSVVVVPGDLHWLAVRYHGMFAASLAPLAFTLFGLLAARLSRGKRWALSVGVCGAYLMYLLALSPETLVAFDGPWPGGAVWNPLIVLAIVIAALVAGSFFTGVSNAEVSI